MKKKKKKKNVKVNSTIQRTLEICGTVQLPTWHPVGSKNNGEIPWNFTDNVIDVTLANFSKDTTSPSQFKALFFEKIERLKHFNFIYTDGSRNDDCVGYSIVNEREIIKSLIWPVFCSIHSYFRSA